jgi:hypothetical protein
MGGGLVWAPLAELVGLLLVGRSSRPRRVRVDLVVSKFSIFTGTFTAVKIVKISVKISTELNSVSGAWDGHLPTQLFRSLRRLGTPKAPLPPKHCPHETERRGTLNTER